MPEKRIFKIIDKQVSELCQRAIFLNPADEFLSVKFYYFTHVFFFATRKRLSKREIPPVFHFQWKTLIGCLLSFRMWKCRCIKFSPFYENLWPSIQSYCTSKSPLCPKGTQSKSRNSSYRGTVAADLVFGKYENGKISIEHRPIGRDIVKKK